MIRIADPPVRPPWFPSFFPGRQSAPTAQPAKARADILQALFREARFNLAAFNRKNCWIRSLTKDLAAQHCWF